MLEIARRIGAAAGHDWTEVLLPDAEGRGMSATRRGRRAKPFIVDMSTAERELGYTAGDDVGRGDRRARCVWLIEATRDRDWQDVLPRGAQYLQFDYEGEDALVAELAKA